MRTTPELKLWFKKSCQPKLLAKAIISATFCAQSLVFAQCSIADESTQTRLQLTAENKNVLASGTDVDAAGVSTAVFETKNRIAPKKQLILNGSSRRSKNTEKAPAKVDSKSNASALKPTSNGSDDRPALRDPEPIVPDSKPTELTLEQAEPKSEPTKLKSEPSELRSEPVESEQEPRAEQKITDNSPVLSLTDNDPEESVAETPESEIGPSHLSLRGSDDGEDGKECPGSPQKDGELASDPEDVPLEKQPHPYDAPKAATKSEPDAVASAEDYTTRELDMQRRINKTLDYFMKHPETVVRRGPWALMHASLPFGVESEVIAGSRRVNTLGWMCYNGVCAKQRMFQPTRSGFRTNVGPGVQGHEGQFLAILAQSRVKSDYPIKIGSRKYSIQDLIKYEMATCRERSELTFKLIGLSYYLEPNQRWRDSRGRMWNLEKMVAEELSQPINGVACGGSHRLMGLSYALVQRKRAGEPITGAWARAENYLNDYVNYTMTLQNPDGSFSTEWFEGRGNKPDKERKVQTTGHMLEWLIFTLPDEHLRSPRIQIAVEFLLNTVGSNPEYDWPIGPRGHALRALVLYNQRVFGAEQGKLQEHIATLKRDEVIR
ncbi:MAG: hypothetical protein AAF483_04065 [Planctomycetota bacterium]